MSYKVVYLTGAPAAGKTTACEKLKARKLNVKVFEYGREMVAHLAAHNERVVPSQSALRGGIQTLVSKHDINRVNIQLAAFVKKWGSAHHVIIDTHQVTKETFGFCVSPFSDVEVRTLGLTEVWVLFTSAETTISRIDIEAGGRQRPTPFEADFHTMLQSNLAVVYAATCGVPVFLFNSDTELSRIADELESRLAAE